MAPSTEVIQETERDLTSQASIIIVTYNQDEYIEECLTTVLATGPGEVVVVDNGSTDRTVEIIESEFPEVDVIQPDENLGYGSASNRGVEEVDSEYVVVLNPDTRVEPTLLEELLKPLATAEDDHLITIPKILTYSGDETNTIGNVIHFSGLGFTRGFGAPPDTYSEPTSVSGFSGACFAMTRRAYWELGGFEESIFIYMDDVEMSWKANAIGFDIRYIPTAVVFHDYSGVDLDAKKLFHLERGRYIILRKYLSPIAATLIAPSLLMTELLTWGYVALHGPAGVKAKLRAISDGFSTNVKSVETDRRTLLCRLDKHVPADKLRTSRAVGAAIKVANKLYGANLSLACR